MDIVDDIKANLHLMQSKATGLAAKGRSFGAKRAQKSQQAEYDRLKKIVCDDLQHLYHKMKITEEGQQDIPLNDDQRQEAYRLRHSLAKLRQAIEKDGCADLEHTQIMSSGFDRLSYHVKQGDEAFAAMHQEARELERRRTPWRPSTWQPLLLDRDGDTADTTRCKLRETDIKLPDIPDFENLRGSLLKPEDERTGEEVIIRQNVPAASIEERQAAKKARQERHKVQREAQEAQEAQKRRRAEQRAQEEAKELDIGDPAEGNGKRKA